MFEVNEWHKSCYQAPMKIHHALCALTLAASAMTVSPAYAQSNWDVVLNGRAVHINSSHDWNDDNWGLGVEREFNADGRWVKVALANGFRDSADEPSYMAGGGLKRRFRLFDDRFYVDLGMMAF